MLAVLAFALTFALPAQAAGQETVDVTIVASHGTKPYQDAVAGLREVFDADASLTVRVVTLSEAEPAATVVARVAATQPALVVTVGSKATAAAVGGITDIPIVATLVLTDAEVKRADNATAVLLSIPIEVQLDWIRRVMPDRKVVGILYGEERNSASVARASRHASSMGLKVVARRVSSPREIPAALDEFSRVADVMLGLPDKVVLNPKTARALLLFSFRNRIPFVGPSKAWTKAGALYSLERDYRDMGRQAAAMGKAALSGKPPVTQSAREVRTSVNKKTAHHMRITLPSVLLERADSVE